MSHPDCLEPYIGIEPYAESDQFRFFGRAEECKAVIAQLYGPRLTIFYGASGVGKTSLIRAGVLPELRKTPRLAVLIFRNWQEATFQKILRQDLLTTTFESLNRRRARAISPADFHAAMHEMVRRSPDLEGKAGSPADAVPAPTTFDSASLEDSLKHLSLAELTMLCCQAIRGRIFFIFDQFEEYFVYHPTNEPHNDFESQLADVILDERVPAGFLFSLREDGLSKIDRLKSRVPGLLSNLFRLEHLSEEGAAAAIQKPIDLYNKDRPEAQKVTVEPALAQALVNDIKPGQITTEQTDVRVPDLHRSVGDGTRVETAYLQMVLHRLWLEQSRQAKDGPDQDHPVKYELSLHLYNRLGRAEGIVQRFVKETMETRLERLLQKDGLESEQIPARVALLQERSAKLFTFLVTSSGTKYAPSLQTLFDVAGYTEPEVLETLKILEELRLVQRLRAEDEKEARYQVKHDILAAAIRIWRDKYIQDANAALVLRDQQKALDAEKREVQEQEKRLREQRLLEEANAQVKTAEAKRQAIELQLKTVEVERLEQGIRAAEALTELEKKRRQTRVLIALLTVAVVCLGVLIWGITLANRAKNLALDSAYGGSIKSIAAYGYARLFPELIPPSPPPPQRPYLLLTAFQAIIRTSQSPSGQLKCPPEALYSVRKATFLAGIGVNPQDARPYAWESYGYLPDFPSPTYEYYVTLESKGQSQVWRADTLGYEHTLGAVTDRKIVEIGFNPGATWFGACFSDKSIAIWEIATGQLVRQDQSSHLGQALGLNSQQEAIFLHPCPQQESLTTYQEVRTQWLSDGLVALGVLLYSNHGSSSDPAIDVLKKSSDELRCLVTAFEKWDGNKVEAANLLVKGTKPFLPLTSEQASKILEDAWNNRQLPPGRLAPPPRMAPPGAGRPMQPPPPDGSP